MHTMRLGTISALQLGLLALTARPCLLQAAAAGVLANLHLQREQLQRTAASNQDIDANLSTAQKILRGMGRRWF